MLVVWLMVVVEIIKNNIAKYKFFYGYETWKEPTGITQGGYSNNIVVNSDFAVFIPKNITFEKAAPLLCAGVTDLFTNNKSKNKKRYEDGVAGIGGLGHMAVTN